MEKLDKQNSRFFCVKITQPPHIRTLVQICWLISLFSLFSHPINAAEVVSTSNEMLENISQAEGDLAFEAPLEPDSKVDLITSKIPTDIPIEKVEELLTETLPEIEKLEESINVAPKDVEVDANLASVSTLPQRIAVREFSIIGISSNTHPTLSQAAIDELLAQEVVNNPAGFTVDELLQLAKVLTHKFRHEGFLLTRVILPEQDITQGVIVFQIFEGYLEKVSINGESKYDENVLSGPFRSLLAVPLNNLSLESAMLHINELPGLSVAGILRPGEKPGTTELLLDIKKEKKFNSSLLFDNYGTALTGKHRVWLGMNYNNLSGAGDKLGMNVVRSEGPDGAAYGSLSYQYPRSFSHPAFEGDYLFGVEYSRNSFQLGQQLKELEVKGESNNAKLFIQRNFLRARKESISGRIDFAYKSSAIKQLNNNISRDKLSVITLNISSDTLEINAATSYQFSLNFHRGFGGLFGAMNVGGGDKPSRTGGSGEVAGGSFKKASFSYTHYYAYSENSAFVMRINGQISDDLLVSMEQMPLGGPNSVRAYPTSEYLFDTAAFLSAEWKFNLNTFYQHGSYAIDSKKEKLELVFFTDFAVGYLNDPLANEIRSTNIKGFGAGLVIHSDWKNTLTSRVDIARPIGNVQSSNKQSYQLHFNMAYQF